MKKIELTAKNVASFTGNIQKKINMNGSIIFVNGINNTMKNKYDFLNKTKKYNSTGTKFGNLRKDVNQMKLTTSRVTVEMVTEGVRILNPLNKNFGYSDITIPFGKVIIMANSFIWIDKDEMWRKMSFSKSPGWALELSKGLMKPYCS